MATPRHPEFANLHIARIKVLPQGQQPAQFQELRAQLQDDLVQIRASSTSMSASDYLNLLAGLDVGSASARQDFHCRTRLSDVDPVPIGTHAGYDYYLLPNDESVPPSNNPGSTPLDAMLLVAPFADAYRRIQMQGHPPGGPDLKFGLGLGSIYHVPAGTFPPGEPVDPGRVQETGFLAVLNAADKSVWATVDWYPTWRHECPYTDADTGWGVLPGDGTYQIGTTRISQPGWKVEPELATSITGGDPWNVGAPMGCRLERVDAKVADIATVVPQKP